MIQMMVPSEKESSLSFWRVYGYSVTTAGGEDSAREISLLPQLWGFPGPTFWIQGSI